MTTISDHGRSCASVFEMSASAASAAPTINAVVVTRRSLQARPISAAAWPRRRAAATMITWSALSTASRMRVCRPSNVVSHPSSAPGPAAPTPSGDLRNVAWFQRSSASRATNGSLAGSSAMTLVARTRAFGSWMRNRSAAAVVMRADSLSTAVPASERGVGGRRARDHRLARAVLEGLVRRQHDRRRPHALVLAGDAGRRAPLVDERLDRLEQPVPGHDDAVVGGHQVFLRAIDDRPHALLQRGVLHADALDAAEGPAGLLRGPIDQVVVVLVGERTVGARLDLDVDALAVAHRRQLRGRQLADRVVVEAPRPAGVVVDGDPEMAVHRVIAARRDHREGRHDPLRDAPVVLALLGVAARADIEPPGALDHLEDRPRVAQGVLVALGPLEQRIRVQVAAVEERHVARVDPPLHGLQPVRLL